MQKNITIPIKDHTHLIISEKWMKSICRAFYENCALCYDGKSLEMTLDGKDQIINLIKFYNPDLFTAITEYKIKKENEKK